LDRRLDGTQSWSALYAVEKNLIKVKKKYSKVVPATGHGGL
jgi:hypothetical protein